MKSALFGLALAALTLAGCGFAKKVANQIGVSTNLPFFHHYSVGVVNASDFNIEILANGKTVLFGTEEHPIQFLKPGDHEVLYFGNWRSDVTQEVTVTVKAWSGERIAGAASRKLWVYSSYTGSQADEWIIRNNTFRYAGWFSGW
jgi:hypothetical protein